MDRGSEITLQRDHNSVFFSVCVKYLVESLNKKICRFRCNRTYIGEK